MEIILRIKINIQKQKQRYYKSMALEIGTMRRKTLTI